MIDLRKILIIIIIGVLYVVLCFAVTSSIYDKPKYEDYCNQPMYYAKPIPTSGSYNCTTLPPNPQMEQDCIKQEHARVDYRYDSNGCPTEVFCNTCEVGYYAAEEKYNMYVFIVFSILGLIAIVAGLFMSPEVNELNKWVGSGFIAGGLAAMFFGIGYYYKDMLRYYRPIVLAIEIAIVIFVFYREMGMYSKMIKEDAKASGKGKRK